MNCLFACFVGFLQLIISDLILYNGEGNEADLMKDFLERADN